MRRAVLRIAWVVLAAGCYREAPPAAAYVPKTAAVDANAQALAAWRGGDLDAALQFAESAYAADPLFAEAEINRAVLLGKTENYEGAIAALGNVIARENPPPEARLYLGIFLERDKRPDEARVRYGEALEAMSAQSDLRTPAPERALKLAVVTYLYAGRIEGIKALNDVLTAYPTYEEAKLVKLGLTNNDRKFFLDWLTRPASAAAPAS